MIEPEAIYIIVDDEEEEAMRHSLKNLIQSGTTGQNFASVQEFCTASSRMCPAV